MDASDRSTERLIVRALEPEDIEVLRALWCNPAATAYLGGHPAHPENAILQNNPMH